MQAGEFIQVILMSSRAGNARTSSPISRRKLDQGINAGSTNVTRTLNGSAYPTPGLSSKFYDAEMDPLVEAPGQVGRHDTFALACNANYYEDIGYSGHANCTDNFTGKLAAHGRRRKGWPAINFFFNTAVAAPKSSTSTNPGPARATMCSCAR